MKHLLQGVLTLLLAASPAVADRTVSKTLPLAADGKVTIDTYKGSIRVTPWDRAEVAVEARIVPDDSCGSEKDQKEWVAATEVVIEPSGRNVRIESDYDKLETSWGFFRACTSRPFVHYRVSLPRAATLKIHDYKSDTDVKDFAGHLALDTYKGSVALVRPLGRPGPEDVQGRGAGGVQAPLGSRACRDLQGRRDADVSGRVGLRAERGCRPQGRDRLRLRGNRPDSLVPPLGPIAPRRP